MVVLSMAFCPKLPKALGFLMDSMTNIKTLRFKPTILGTIAAARENYSQSSSLKKLVILIAILLIVSITYLTLFSRKNSAQLQGAVSEIIKVDKSFDFPAVNNSGKATGTKVKFKISQAERTDRVLVKDQSVKATNKKLFLVINLDLKNDATIPVNITPGDLIRLTYANDKENLYAPDLHNNAVQIAPISTRNDRLGFVIPQEVSQFKLLVGELEKKKEEVQLKFDS